MSLPHKHLILSFDDGPNNITTPKLLDTLKKENVKATFFMVGANIDNPTLMQRMLNDGHILGSHTWGHAHMTRLNHKDMIDQIIHEEKVFTDVVGDRPFFFRPPYGEINNEIRQFLNERHYIVWKWNFDTFDWNKHKPVEVYDAALNVVNHGDNGGIVLMHEYTWTTEAQKTLIPELKEKGYVIRDPLDMLSTTEMEQLKKWSCTENVCEKFAKTRRWCDCKTEIRKLRSMPNIQAKVDPDIQEVLLVELYKIEALLLIMFVMLTLLIRRHQIFKKII